MMNSMFFIKKKKKMMNSMFWDLRGNKSWNKNINLYKIIIWTIVGFWLLFCFVLWKYFEKERFKGIYLRGLFWVYYNFVLSFLLFIWTSFLLPYSTSFLHCRQAKKHIHSLYFCFKRKIINIHIYGTYINQRERKLRTLFILKM